MASTTSLVAVDSVGERSVRFKDECVLIPECSRPRKGLIHLNSRPRLASKSFTLPIWPSTTHNYGWEKTDHDEEKERGRKLTLPIPSFGQPKSSSSAPPVPMAMPPCLRSPDRESSRQSRRSTSPPRHGGVRPRSLSQPLATLPLRGCCKACIPAVDAFLASPSGPERMTTGAKRLQRSAAHQDLPTESKVMVDEVDMVRKDLHTVTISESAEDVEEAQAESPPSAPKESKPKPKGLAIGICYYDDADECELFPLPSPSPRSSPRNSPAASPAASQTNLVSPNNRSTTPSPVNRGNSPLAVCCSVETEEPEHSSDLFLREEASVASSQSDAARSPKAESPLFAHPKPRRPSLSAIGTGISKGGLAIVKGLSGLGGNPTL